MEVGKEWFPPARSWDLQRRYTSEILQVKQMRRKGEKGEGVKSQTRWKQDDSNIWHRCSLIRRSVSKIVWVNLGLFGIFIGLFHSNLPPSNGGVWQSLPDVRICQGTYTFLKTDWSATDLVVCAEVRKIVWIMTMMVGSEWYSGDASWKKKLIK